MDRMQRNGQGSLSFRIRTHPAFLIGLLVVIALFSRSVYRLHGAYGEAKAKALQAEGELSRVAKRKSELETLVNGLETERGRETEIRSRYQVVKEGERVVLFGSSSTTAPVQ